MKVNLKFDTLDEEYDLKCALMGKEAILSLWQIQEDLRSKIKWFPDDKDEKILEGLEEAQKIVHDIMFEYDVLGLVNTTP